MKTYQSTIFIALLAAAAVFVATTPTHAEIVGSWNVVISPAESGAKTNVSFYATGDLLTGYAVTSTLAVSGKAIGVSGLGTSPSNAWTVSGTYRATFPQFGTYTNVTTGSTRPLTEAGFQPAGGSTQFFSLFWPVMQETSGNTVQYAFNATPTDLVFDLPFSSFNPGTYNTAAGDLQYNMTIVAPVPEPATYCMALAGIACGGYSMWRRRKRA